MRKKNHMKILTLLCVLTLLFAMSMTALATSSTDTTADESQVETTLDDTATDDTLTEGEAVVPAEGEVEATAPTEAETELVSSAPRTRHLIVFGVSVAVVGGFYILLTMKTKKKGSGKKK